MSLFDLFSKFVHQYSALSNRYTTTFIPTSLLFEFSEEEVRVYYDLELSKCFGFNRVYKTFERNTDDLRMQYIILADVGNYKSIDHYSAFQNEIPQTTAMSGFPHIRYFKTATCDYYWFGHHIEMEFNTYPDLEKYIESILAIQLDQLQLHYQYQLLIPKNEKPTLFNEQISSIVPNWGEFGLDCIYLNAHEYDDYNKGFRLGTSMQLTGPLFRKHFSYQDLISALYRACVRFKINSFNNNPLVEKNAICYPTLHGSYEHYNEKKYNEALASVKC